MIGIWIAALYLLAPTAGEKVCYGRLGCFSDKPPWAGIPGRYLAGLPDSPESMNISFTLYTKETRNNSQVISAIHSSTIKDSHFCSHRKTRFIVHGFMSTGKRGWVVEMCLLLVEVEDVNCIAVDWADGAKGIYISAVNNIRVVGAEIAYFINTLMNMFQYCPSHIHIIGHSLGAHAAGDAGRRIRGIKRITGLDPAGPFFEDTPPKVRLDPTDARFVDVIHSNAAQFPTVGLGMVNTTGHLDFYPNGGSIMPGCDDVIIPLTKKDCRVFAEDANSPICHHSRSHQFYFQSILHPNGFLGYPCRTYEFFRSGLCFPCPREGCPMMGHYADQYPAKLEKINQKYFLNTGAHPPFTSWSHRISIKLSGTKKVRGELNIVLHGTDGFTKQYEIICGLLHQGSIYTKYVDVEINPRNITKVEFLWNKNILTLLWARLGAEMVHIINEEDGHVSTYCGKENVKYGIPQSLTPC
ncbi:pancreatic lipase-related protein 2-like [Gopherus evgoodei]|uniref:pancreatic lipase-related protein 2-like n=1 Tax=Gopherus evgoodei TaxID=1825980 RepID=UPI0011D01939|nr:pancreatic lipase-related protein 2-like [Gopherus evgoodei]